LLRTLKMNEMFSPIGAFFWASVRSDPETQNAAHFVQTNTDCQFFHFSINEINDLNEIVRHGAATYFRTDSRLDRLNVHKHIKAHAYMAPVRR